MVDLLGVIGQIGNAVSFFTNVFGTISGFAASVANLVGITSAGQNYAIIALIFLMAAFFMFKFMELLTKFLIFVILIWVVASIFGLVG